MELNKDIVALVAQQMADALIEHAGRQPDGTIPSPPGDKQVFLRLRLNQAIFPGCQQGDKSTPCQVTRFFHISHII
ncbi:hypothetical protein LUD23_30440, partial [Klebsiella pneumoniae]|nr:hypothetical protein [Klebsiella pneumoniae]